VTFLIGGCAVIKSVAARVCAWRLPDRDTNQRPGE